MRIYEIDIVPSGVKQVIRMSKGEKSQVIGFALTDHGEYYDYVNDGYVDYAFEISDEISSVLTPNADPAGRYSYLQISNIQILTAAAGKFLATIRLRKSAEYEEGDPQIRIPLFLEIEEEPQ